MNPKNLTIKDLKKIKEMIEGYKSLMGMVNGFKTEVEADPYIISTLDHNYNYTNIVAYLEYVIPNIEEYLDEPTYKNSMLNDETTITITYL